jgi:predicted dehydrogenase
MTWKIAGINFDHMHMGDNLRMAYEHPEAEIVALCDEQPARMEEAAGQFQIPQDRCFTDVDECIEKSRPDIVLLCPATNTHCQWVEKVAPHGVHIILEKPFAASLADADRMIELTQSTGKLFAINWPMAWYAGNRTAKRLLDEGTIGQLSEVHYYDGNRGPLYHLADKAQVSVDQARKQKQSSWFYQRSSGGGALLDYLGYGTTLGSWYHGGKLPLEVTTVVDEPSGLEVEEHSITVARYEHGLSKFEARWGTFTDPWVTQPQPKCGFVLTGTDGTISSYDMEPTVRVQTGDCPAGRDVAVDPLESPHQNPVQYVIDCLETGAPVEGPLSPEISRLGQQIIDAAQESAREKRTVCLGES